MTLCFTGGRAPSFDTRDESYTMAFCGAGDAKFRSICRAARITGLAVGRPQRWLCRARSQLYADALRENTARWLA